MPDLDIDRNLLLALIALRNHFIDQAQMIAALNDWASHKEKPLGRVLIASGAAQGG